MSLDITLFGLKCPECGKVVFPEHVVFTINITHNLVEIAKQAGVYYFVWRPDEMNLTQAKQLIRPLTTGLEILKANYDYLKSFNPSNGWGSHSVLISQLETYLAACQEHPDAKITVSR